MPRRPRNRRHGDKHQVVYRVRLNEPEEAALRALAVHFGESVSGVFRRGLAALADTLVEPIPEGEPA